jgi:hypothetical protein
MRNPKLIEETITTRYLDFARNGFMQGHYMDIDFTIYLELVQTLIMTYREVCDKPIYLTGLCITPWQWFNTRMSLAIAAPASVPSEIDSLRHIGKMEADRTWLKYHDFLKRLICTPGCTEQVCPVPIHQNSQCFSKRPQNIKSPPALHRRIITVEDKIYQAQKSVRYNFPKKSVVENQFSHYLVYSKVNKKAGLNSLSKKEISEVCQGTIPIAYKNLGENSQAYLIVDDDMLVRIDQSSHLAEKLEDIFIRAFHRLKAYYKTVVIDEQQLYDMQQNSFPEDFFLAGQGTSLREASWDYCLAADVTSDKRKLRLWFLTNDAPLGYDEPAIREPLFNFDKIQEYLKLHGDSLGIV